MKKIVYYVNQFYGQIGGEEAADQTPIVKEGSVWTSCCNAGGTERYWRGCRNDRLW